MGQESQGRFEDTALLSDIPRIAHCPAAFEPGEGGAGWRRNAGASGIPTGERGGDACPFECACDQSNGLGTQRSRRDEQCCPYRFRFGDAQHFGDEVIFDTA